MTSLLFLVTGIVIGFIIGVLSTLLFTKNKQPVKNKVELVTVSKSVENVDPRIIETRELINIVKSGQKIECYCNPKILKGIKLLANEPNWEQQIDDETLNILSDINIKRKKFVEAQKLNSGTKNGIRIDKENSHVSDKTPDDYEQEGEKMWYWYNQEDGTFDLCENGDKTEKENNENDE